MTEYLDEINAVDDNGDVVPREAREPVIFEPEVADPPEADEFDEIAHQNPRQVVSDSLRARIEDWLDLHYHENPTLKQACERYGVTIDAYEASDAVASEKRLPSQPVHDHLSGRDVIHANDEAMLAACRTDAERQEVRARIMARNAIHDREINF